MLQGCLPHDGQESENTSGCYSTPGQADSGLLTSAEVGPSVPHHRHITTWQHVQILNRVQMQPLFTITS